MDSAFMMMPELPILWTGLLLLVLAGTTAIIAQVMARRPYRTILSLLVMVSVLLTAAVVTRWLRLGYGPFATMFEILLSNLWSLTLIYTLVFWRLVAIRPSAGIVLSILFTMMAWMLVTDPTGVRLPASFDTIWLYVHIGFGKIFFAALLVAVGLALAMLLRRYSRGRITFARMPNDASLDELMYRCLAISLIFDTLMLIAGAIWAQNAWGRYWAWDPLETASLVTWILLALALHVRATFRITMQISSWLVITVFVVSFLTFYGIPFLSDGPHFGTF